MARRRKKFNSLDYIRLPKVDLDPDMKRGVFIILILAFGAISFLSLFGLAEGLGKYLEQGIIFLFGWGKWLFPMSAMAIGFLMYNRDKEWARGANYLGLFIFLIFFSALLHITVGQDYWLSAVKQGEGGGYIGYGIISIFSKIMGFLGKFGVCNLFNFNFIDAHAERQLGIFNRKRQLVRQNVLSH